MNKLPYDRCRCQGRDCDRKGECLRVAAMNDMGPATPWTERYCPANNVAEGFIAIRKEARE